MHRVRWRNEGTDQINQVAGDAPHGKALSGKLISAIMLLPDPKGFFQTGDLSVSDGFKIR
jgi:hypothetical protein